MTNIENLRQAIERLRRGISECQVNPDNPHVQLSVLHSFEVTYNLAESFLREACVERLLGPEAAYFSTRELIWRASEEGVEFPSRRQWVEYGTSLESMRDTCMLSGTGNLAESLQVLGEFARGVEAFADSLQERLAFNV
ncbi:MAG TPA: hypothetical protein VHU44_03410 [Acidobacteriaceae bacterium]|jgi:hypothetical protein|nr:hypothetical protein [Acidobacteriaceae bacterium]